MVEIFKTLSDQSRIRIISLLMYDDMCVCEIEAVLKFTQSNASRHLIELKRTGILDSYKKAQWTYYKANQAFIQENKELWEYILKKSKELPTYEKDYAEYKKIREKNICNKNN